MPKGVPDKRYTPEFKKLVVETMLKEKLRQHRTIALSPKQKTSNHKRSDAFQNLLARQTSIKPPDRVCQLKSSLPKQTYYSFLRFAFATLGIASFEREAAA